MEKKDIEKQLEDVIVKLHTKQQQMGILSAVLPRNKIRDVDEQLANSLAYLRVCTSDLMLEIESLRRENERLREKLGDG